MIEADQRRRLAATVSHATRHVPYYRETMDRLGLVPADFATAADLARLPLLERLEVQRNPQRFVSDAQPIERYVPLKTGGSSGQPLTVYYDHFALVHVDLNPVRIVDDDSREVPDGESGKVVISNLVSRGSILLNYRLGNRPQTADPLSLRALAAVTVVRRGPRRRLGADPDPVSGCTSRPCESSSTASVKSGATGSCSTR